MPLRVDPVLGGFARAMRKQPTPIEQRLWRHLRSSQLGGFKFRRQAVIDRYICDFFCPQKGMVIEIDGDTHDAARDALRDARLQSLGFHVLRFSHGEVGTHLAGVLEAILATVRALPARFTHPPAPSLEREGEA